MKKLTLLLLSFLGLFSLSAAETPLWLRYASISPDGNSIAFNYKGNIYLIAAEGGQAMPLTINNSYDYLPVWSPDSKKIAFASDRHGNFDVFLISVAGGKAERITFHSANDLPQSFSVDGNSILFTSQRKMNAENVLFPYGRFNQLYKVSVNGDLPKMELSIPLEHVSLNKNGNKMLYMDLKGYEDFWRKHHQSSIARDIWMYDRESEKHTKLSNFEGEDRNPIWSETENEIYYLSESSGSFNVWSKNIETDTKKQLTNFEDHPVRFLSSTQSGKLAFTFHGQIYTMSTDGSPEKINITIPYEEEVVAGLKTLSSGATEMALSPNGKEVAFVVRGEVFVTGLESGMTKRITNTPEQERSVNFSPEGDKIVYAGERNGSWNIYETEKVLADEPYFYGSTLLKEKALLSDSEEETFQPAYSPDGKELAYLSNRTTLKVLNLASGQSRIVLPGEKNYSYSDGDQYYAWSPDSKWFTVDFIDKQRWVSELGVVKADGSQEVKNLSESGYTEGRGSWAADGSALYFMSDRQGFRSHGSWGSQMDVYAMYLTKEAYDKFTLSKDELALVEAAKKSEDNEDGDKAKNKDKNKDEETEKVKVEIDFNNLVDRVKRLTLSSTFIQDMAVSKDGEKLYYTANRDNEVDLWELNIREKSTKTIGKMKSGGSMVIDKEGKHLLILADGGIMKVELSSGKMSPVGFKAEMILDQQAERAYMFEHMWRQVQRKFYDPALHGIDWDMYKKAYATFLPHINNNRDFAEMMSELLGELNGSHTGCRYYTNNAQGDETAALGIIPDYNYTGAGIKIAAVLDKSPLAISDKNVIGGMIISKIDGNALGSDENYFPLLNHKAGKMLVLEVTDASGKSAKTVKIKAITQRTENNLLYERWVKSRRAATEKLSEGRLGYVHVRGMNSSSFREVYAELLGRYNNKEAVIVDTRFNGGGWLHDDLATLLSGKMYVKLAPRGQYIGSEPQGKWQKPSAVLVGEGNYSDAHFFPYTYRALDIGKIIGMPVPGTATAVWWERQINRNIVFGIPQVGVQDMDGNYLENQQLAPDIKVKNMPSEVIEGEDAQLRKAVEVLLQDLE